MKELIQQIKEDPTYSLSNSWTWYNNKVKELVSLNGASPMKMLGDHIKQQTSYVVPGGMYMYFYDPKYKEVLPYYDTFPLMLPFSANKTHMTGINLHYMHPRYRLRLLQKLLNTINDKTLNNRTKLRINWKLLSNVSRFPEVQDCVKQYLLSHVKSRFLKIKPEDWIITMYLPLSRFKKVRAEDIWKS